MGADGTAERFLLQLMARPATAIASVQEKCLVGENEYIREVTARIRAPKDAGVNLYFVDLIHPRKTENQSIELQIDDPDVRQVSHEEHLDIACRLIRAQFEATRASMSIPKRHRESLNRELDQTLESLLSIPRSGEAAARKVFDDQFSSEDMVLEVITAYPGVAVSRRLSRGLFRLCKRLVYRYLVLVQFGFNGLDERKITFRYRTASPNRSEISESPSRSHLVRRARYGSVPVNFVVHIPWAKRTNHYGLTVEPPESYFVAESVALYAGQAATNSPIYPKYRYEPTNRVEPRMMIDASGGNRCEVFVGDGPLEMRRLFVGLEFLERPGRSTSRVLVLARFVTAALAVSAAIRVTFDGNAVLDSMSIVLALLSITAFSVAPGPGSGVIGTPLLARVMPIRFGPLSSGFLLWFASFGFERSTRVADVPGWTVAIGGQFGQLWLNYAGWVCVLLAALGLVRVAYREKRIVSAYVDAQQRTQWASGNFYE